MVRIWDEIYKRFSGLRPLQHGGSKGTCFLAVSKYPKYPFRMANSNEENYEASNLVYPRLGGNSQIWEIPTTKLPCREEHDSILQSRCRVILWHGFHAGAGCPNQLTGASCRGRKSGSGEGGIFVAELGGVFMNMLILHGFSMVKRTQFLRLTRAIKN